MNEINIYVDPFGKTMLEGTASIINKIGDYNELVHVSVRFNDGITTSRFICREDYNYATNSN